MKLSALRDRIDDADKDLGRHHALDLYAVVGSMNIEEWDAARAMHTAHAQNASMKECDNIVSTLFATSESRGILRLRESAYYRCEFDLQGFIRALKDLFDCPLPARPSAE